MAYCAGDAARERCGLLLGRRNRVTAVTPLPNVAPDPATAFAIADEALIAAARDARIEDCIVIGHFHSHPGGPARPSARDAEAAAGDGGRFWLIVGSASVAAWRFTGDGPAEGFAAVRLAIASDGT